MATVTTWRSVMTVHSALTINERELFDYVNFSSEAGMRRGIEFLSTGGGPGAPNEAFWLEMFRLLANYTSMNSTLIDHVRNVMRIFHGSDFAAEEEERRQELGNAPVTRFVKDLRNYITHHTVPPLEIQLQAGAKLATSVTARLGSEALLEWSGWTAQSKAYLNDTKSIDIAEAVADYSRLRSAYYTWLFEQRLKNHGPRAAD